MKTWVFGLISLALIVGLVKWAHFLFTNSYITECFETTHNINLPLTTTSSCKNWCGPMARCSITGEQCSTDVDCYGCKPTIRPNFIRGDEPRGNNEAGKYAMISPNYSTLTTDYGTSAKLITNNKFSKPPTYMIGTNVWRDQYDVANKLFGKRYNVKHAPLNKGTRYSLSGEFIEDGALPANAYM